MLFAVNFFLAFVGGQQLARIAIHIRMYLLKINKSQIELDSHFTNTDKYAFVFFRVKI